MYMNWELNDRYAFLIAETSKDGKLYQTKEAKIGYEKRNPNGLVLENLIKKYADNNINLYSNKIDEYSKIIFDRMIKV